MSQTDRRVRARHGRGWIFLVGFSGAGKSSVGRALAKRLGWRFVDLDDAVERDMGQSISQIFARSGESTFRRRELTSLRRIVAGETGGVVALGGGAYEQAALRSLVRAHGTTVYLSCSQSELYRRLRNCQDRPLLNVHARSSETVRQARMRRIRFLMKKRLANYRRTDLILSTTKRTAVQAAAEIVRRLNGGR